jgi:hypothetical protein
MSSLTLVGSAVALDKEADAPGSTYISVTLRHRTATHQETWDLISSELRRGLQRAGYAQPEEVIEERARVPERWVIIAPGIMVRPEEYRERYAALDLESLRERMSPSVFAAFVRHVGCVSGREELDIDDLSQIPDER